MSGGAKNGKVPRALIICCEGKTEKAYFETLLDFYRPPAYVMVEVLGQKGQHEALVDRTVEERASLCEEYELGIDDVECWAVCDEDAMALSYVELAAYADGRGVAPSLACAWRDQLEQSAPGVSHHARPARSDHREVRGEALQREGLPVARLRDARGLVPRRHRGSRLMV